MPTKRKRTRVKTPWAASAASPGGECPGSRFHAERAEGSGQGVWNRIVKLLLAGQSVEILQRDSGFELRRWENVRTDCSNRLDADPATTY